MLKGIEPLLHAELLRVLRAMGHGDDLVVVDANFPADATARATATGTVLRLDGIGVARAVEAILTVLPLDTFVAAPVARMAMGSPDTVPPVQREVMAALEAAEGGPVAVESLERFAFYERARGAYAVVATGERRFYGCFILKKGVIAPEGGA